MLNSTLPMLDGGNFGTTKMDALSTRKERYSMLKEAQTETTKKFGYGEDTTVRTKNGTLSTLTYQSQRLISRTTHHS